MNLPRLDSSSLLLASLLACTAAFGSACGGGGSGGGPANAAGTISFLPNGAPFAVHEPNDSVDQPQELGDVSAGMRLELCDEVDPANDPLDAFRMHSDQRLRVTARLVRLRGEGTLPHLMVYDPVAMQPISITSTGTATFVLHGSSDLVVRASDATVQYALRLRFEAVRALAETEIEAGQVGAEDRLDVMLAPEPRLVRFTTREALRIVLPVSAGVEARDLATGVLFTLDAGGEVDLPALARVQVALPARAPEAVLAPGAIPSAATLRATITARAATNRAPIRAAGRAPVPRLELEGATHSQPFYGRPVLRAMRGELMVEPRANAALDGVFASRDLHVRDGIPGDVVLVAFDSLATSSDEDESRRAVALAESFAGETRVEYAERNLIRHALGTPVLTPNDAFYPLQWHYPLLHLPEAWGITTGDDSIIVAVIDTGETAHPDLAGRQIAGYDFISNVTVAADGDGRDPDPTDVGDGEGVQPSSFHGTHVSGTIGAATNNSIGVSGVTWSGKLMSLRVLGVGGGSDFDIANAIRYAARLSNASSTLPPQRANVINMSLGGSGSSSTVQSAVTAARGQGVVVFAASGNENTGTPSYPAAYSGVISVAAVDHNANRSPYSNFGSSVDVAAPGGDMTVDLDGDGYPDGVLSTLYDQSHSPVYGFYQGTSMACPHAAGVAALMLAADPGLTPAEIETILKETATDLGAPGRDDLYGAGLINAFRAVQVAAGIPTSGTPVLAIAPQSIAFGTGQTTIGVGVSNAGSGLLDIDTLTVSTMDGAPWLSATPVAVPVPVSTDTSSITVHVTRTGLADGNYTGTVTVASNGGMQVIDVSMSVDAALSPVDINLFVLAVDSTTFESVAEVVVNPTTGLAFQFTDLPEGEYIIAAGSDDNANDVILDDSGDLYGGIYPNLNQPVAVRVNGSDVTDLDFPVTSLAPVALILGGGRPTFQRRPVHAR